MPPKKTQRKPKSLGNVYDLQSIYDRLNRIYFDSSLQLDISWSQRRPQKAKTSIGLGSYYPDERLITISRRLDNLRVPLFFVEHVVFHEMLHAVFPSEKHKMHTDKFKRFERMHPDYERAVAWEKSSLDLLFEPAQSQLQL